ncbi:HD domain-containing protein [Vibrio tubiashii]|uniref:HD domain-containing protein n=1 Tax=Vibrio tubiashii TaxID=29498 RepID=UPI001EFD5BD5|nr:HD domain-containing protein [Vibrio tubiashii]MCG9580074.1 HD domain-containing protein [Vibrio tubiashii]MCG9613665.1 HD domain-containing protein [Vibrio tubiashii]MCG9686912.1 HD domain-containing protein [Vibrio tubiashii]
MFEFIEKEMIQDPAHDINHVKRVVKTARNLCAQENAKLEVVLPAAYLHDCFTFAKNHPERSKSSVVAADKAIVFLTSIRYPAQYLGAIHHAIVTHSYSANITPQTLEAQIVQDADRLDALGAIGIARCLQVSTNFGASIYNSDDPFCENREFDDKNYTVDHFYNKLFKLEQMMNTDAAKTEARIRTQYMRTYLAQLASEI